MCLVRVNRVQAEHHCRGIFLGSSLCLISHLEYFTFHGCARKHLAFEIVCDMHTSRWFSGFDHSTFVRFSDMVANKFSLYFVWQQDVASERAKCNCNGCYSDYCYCYWDWGIQLCMQNRDLHKTIAAKKKWREKKKFKQIINLNMAFTRAAWPVFANPILVEWQWRQAFGFIIDLPQTFVTFP